MNIVRSLMVFDASIDPHAFARACREWGIDTPCLSPEFLDDDRMARALGAQGLRSWLNVPVFCDQKYLARHPEAYAITSLGRRAAQDWLHFVCPSRDEYIDSAVQVLRGQLTRLSPAVVSLDFIRHFVFWEKIALDGPSDDIEDGCYCLICLSRFENACGHAIDRKDPVSHIHRHLLKEWAGWKCSRILEVAGRFFGEIRALVPGVKIAVQTLPWRETDLGGAIRRSAGQDVAGLARHVDMVAPMAFTHMLGQNARWKDRLLADVRASTGKPICFYVQTEALYRSGSITVEQFDAELTQARNCNPAAVVVFEYEQLTAQPDKVAVLQKHFRT